ncbi:hypothetical protein K1W54_41665, partial [Micromonospora sp. CPCC 205371]|nr:hypothetical protein [Micromonospora sp. CPCC 205371]
RPAGAELTPPVEPEDADGPALAAYEAELAEYEYERDFAEWAAEQRRQGRLPPAAPPGVGAVRGGKLATARHPEELGRDHEGLRDDYDAAVTAYLGKLRKAVLKAVEPLWTQARRSSPLANELPGGAQNTAQVGQRSGGRGTDAAVGTPSQSSQSQPPPPATVDSGLATARHSALVGAPLWLVNIMDRLTKAVGQGYDQRARTAKAASAVADQKHRDEQTLGPAGLLAPSGPAWKVTPFLLDAAHAVGEHAARAAAGNQPGDPERAPGALPASERLELPRVRTELAAKALEGADGTGDELIELEASDAWREVSELRPLKERTLAGKLEFFASAFAGPDARADLRTLNHVPPAARAALTSRMNEMLRLRAFEAQSRGKRVRDLGGAEKLAEFEKKTVTERIAEIAGKEITGYVPFDVLAPAGKTSALADMRTFVEVVAFEGLGTGEQLLALDAIALARHVPVFRSDRFSERAGQVAGGVGRRRPRGGARGRSRP